MQSMQGILRSLPLWFSAAWAMGLTNLGFFVVPMLFVHLPTPAIAGAMAGKLFSAQTLISAACALALAVLVRTRRLAFADATGRPIAALALAGALMALLVDFAVSPHIIARDNLALWHGVGTGLYFLQWLCAVLCFGKLVLGTNAAANASDKAAA